MRARPLLFVLLLCAALWPLACSSGGGGSNKGGAATGGVEPCYNPVNNPAFAFDVWGATFNPAGHNDMTVTVDTVDAAHAAEFRLTVACLGVMLAGSPTIDGMPCTFPPPPSTEDATPECPRFFNSSTGLGGFSRARCLFEIVSTEALGIGDGVCADPGRGQYRLTVTIGTEKLQLNQVADNCIAAESCLATFFDINVTPQPTLTPTSTPPPTATATPAT